MRRRAVERRKGVVMESVRLVPMNSRASVREDGEENGVRTVSNINWKKKEKNWKNSEHENKNCAVHISNLLFQELIVSTNRTGKQLQPIINGFFLD